MSSSTEILEVLKQLDSKQYLGRNEPQVPINVPRLMEQVQELLEEYLAIQSWNEERSNG